MTARQVVVDERIAKLEEKLKQEKARKQKIDARKRSIERRQERTEDTRRKILVGAIVMARVERNDWPRERFMAMLDEALTREDDRELFGLGPSASAPHSDQQATS